MCLREGDNVATRNPRSSAETWHASISLQQLELSFSFLGWSHVICIANVRHNVAMSSQQQGFLAQSEVNLSIQIHRALHKKQGDRLIQYVGKCQLEK